MFKNWLKVALRNLFRHKGYSFINLFGLAVGMTCGILIILYVRDELRFDRYPERAESIYRLALEAQSPRRGTLRTARTPPPWAPVLARDYPEIESYVRFKTPLVSWLVSYEERDKRFHESGFYFADPTVFKVFGLRLLRGNPETALRDPNFLVLTESAAGKYFGGEDPMGKTIRLDNTYDFRVTGVMQDVPRASHITFDMLASFESLNALPIYGPAGQYTRLEPNGLNPDVYTYLLFRQGFAPAEFEKKLPVFLGTYLGRQLATINMTLKPFLQPLTAIHLHSRLDAEIRANGSISDIYIFSAIAIFILVIAAINFMNLATARSAGRAQEVGIRKVAGAERSQIIRQFIGESTLLSVLSMILAVVLTRLLLPLFGLVSGKPLSLANAGPWLAPSLAGLALVVGLLAGSYPAFFLSGFQPVNVLKGSLRSGASNVILRKTLVVFQFAVSLVFIIGTGVVDQQLRFIRTKSLGFVKENVVVLPLGDPRARPRYQAFKDLALQSSDVVAAAGASHLPGGLSNIGFVVPEGAPASDQVAVEMLMVDEDFIGTMGMEMAAGRGFSRDFPTDRTEAVVLNEAAVRLLGWQDGPLDKRLRVWNRMSRVIGVVKDIHMKSLHHRIDPLVLLIAPVPDVIHHVAVRIRPDDVPRTLGWIEAKWRQVYPNDAFVHTFLKDDYDGLYRAENSRGRIFVAFAVLTIIIACLGLFGLASFSAEQRKKEVGIRKVMGASVHGLTRLLTMEFVRLVLLANVIAWPVAFLFMRRWLQTFAYRTVMGWWIYPAAASLAIAIALLTVGFQAVRAALANPVDSIRIE